MTKETIGARIAKLRNEFSYSQEYVAEKLGVSRQAVSKWEQNQTAPDTYNLIALAELFNVSVEYLAIGKIQEQKAEVKKIEKPQPKNTQRIIGYILLGAGLLSLILGIILEEFLITASIYFIVIGILCLTVRKNFVLVLLGTHAIAFLIGVLPLTKHSFGFNIRTIIFFSCIIALIVVITITLFKLIKKIKLRKNQLINMMK